MRPWNDEHRAALVLPLVDLRHCMLTRGDDCALSLARQILAEAASGIPGSSNLMNSQYRCDARSDWKHTAGWQHDRTLRTKVGEPVCPGCLDVGSTCGDEHAAYNDARTCIQLAFTVVAEFRSVDEPTIIAIDRRCELGASLTF